MKTKLNEIVQERILILDGAMGTVIQQYGLTESDFQGQLPVRRRADSHSPVLVKGNNDMLCVTRPDVITDIHERYLKAGADIITTNTFNAQRISQADYQTEEYARLFNIRGAQLARQAADKYSTTEKPRFVAGSVGPTNKTCSMSPDVIDPAKRELTYDELFDAYTEQMEGLIEGGVDIILIETIFDTLNAKVAIDAALQTMRRMGRELPIMLSVTISDLAGRTLSGQTLDAFLASVDSYPIFSVGLNCSFGARQMKPYLKELARRAPYYISAHPNAGLPNQMGLYDETPETMAPQIAEFIDEGLVNIVGGCCGTTPDFIEKYAPLVVGKKTHTPSNWPKSLWLSGLDLLELTPEIPFVNVGERCNVAGSRKFLRLIKEKNYEEALSIARKQVTDGALVIDINMDDGLLNARQEMVTFLNMIAAEPDISRVPIMIDSSNWDVIVDGLKCVQGKCIVNSISLKEGEEVFIDHARDVAAGLCQAGYRAAMLSGDDSLGHREEILSEFKAKKINYLCVVDIYNEGVDIPEIDTVLFLRPTKSLTIFLQQLGRGLRLAPDKECLTVLDFVAQAHVNYSYESRFRALIPKSKNVTTTAIKGAVAESFTMLPRGCTITMDKLARDYIISNIKSAIFNLRRLVQEVRQFRVNHDKSLTLPTFLEQYDLDIRVIYKTRCWSALLREAGMLSYQMDEFTKVFEKNMSRLIHVNSVSYLGFISRLIDNGFKYEHSAKNNTFALMLYYDLFAKSIDNFGFASVDEGLKKFGAYPLFVDELRQIIQYLSEHLMISTKPMVELGADNVLELFGCYTREEQLAIFGKRTAEKAGAIPQSGVFSLEELNTELLWVTLNKSDKDFSPSTQYEDYAINEALFNWQSQNSASHQNSGRRYVEQRTNGRKFLLFVREHKVDEYGFTSPYYCLGLVDYVKSHGDKPMTITWAMQNHIPGFILDKAQKMAVG